MLQIQLVNYQEIHTALLEIRSQCSLLRSIFRSRPKNQSTTQTNRQMEAEGNRPFTSRCRLTDCIQG